MAFVYPMAPKTPEPVSAEALLRQLPFKPGQYIRRRAAYGCMGAHHLEDGSRRIWASITPMPPASM